MEHRPDSGATSEHAVLSPRNRLTSNETIFTSGEPSSHKRYGAKRTFAGHARLLRPRLRADLIERPRLYPRVDRPFVVVVGPAGAGKTTLISQWLASIDRPSTWLTLDAEDNDLSSFVRHVIAAIQRVDPDVGHVALGALRMPERPPAEMIGSMLADDLHAVTRHMVVVLDDFHEVDSDDVRRLMAPLLRYPAPHVQMCLISRVYPALPLARLRARGELEEIRPDQLRLTETESRHLLQTVIGQGVSGESLSRLLEHYEGWAVGLQFAGLAMRDAKDRDRVAETIRLNGERHSLDFLFEEVFGDLPDEVQEFLMRTSGIPAFTAPLCDVMMWEPAEQANSERMLQWLADRNLYLIPLAGDGGWYRYHHVFRLLLAHQLQARHGTDMAHRLFVRARDWFDDQGYADPAVRLSLVADEPQVAGDIVKRHAQTTLVDGNWQVLESWLSILPPDLVDHDPELLVLEGWCAALRGIGPEAARLTMQSRARLVEAEHPEMNSAGIRAELDCIDVSMRWIIDEPASQVQTLERAIPNLHDGHDFARGHAVFRLGAARASSGNWNGAIHGLHSFANSPESPDFVTRLALTGLVWVYSLKGDVLKASTAADRLLRRLVDPEASPFAMGWAHWLAGCVAYERNDLLRAARLLETAVLNRESIPFVAFQDSLLVLANVYQTTGRAKDADDLLDDLLSLAESVNHVTALECARAYAALFAFQRGRLPAAFRWLEHISTESPATQPMFSLPVQLILARLLIERGGPGDLENASRVTYLMEQRYAGNVLPEKRALQIRVLRSLVAERSGNHLIADEFMREAMDLIQPDGFIRSLVEFGPSVAPLLRRLKPSDQRDRLLRVLEAEVMQPMPAHLEQTDTVTSEIVLPPSSGVHSQDVLTGRELEVLELLRARLSNKEIASALFISPLTVKRHNSNIFDKLGVNSRRQAVRRAEEIGVLPADSSTGGDAQP